MSGIDLQDAEIVAMNAHPSAPSDVASTSRCYAGIGSRRTPAGVLDTMARIAGFLARRGFVLRSGGAEGADLAFERGADAAGGDKAIYLPFPAFNANPSPLHTPSAPAMALAERFHPAWHRCSPAARKLHARNGHQILGDDLASPVDFVVCWTEGGRGEGGTGQALRIARAFGIAVFDLGSPTCLRGQDLAEAMLATSASCATSRERVSA